MATLTLWIPTKQFATSLHLEDDDGTEMSETTETSVIIATHKHDWKIILGHYETLKKLAGLINNVFGAMVVLFLLEALLSYRASIAEMVLSQDWKFIVCDVAYFSHCHFIVAFSADVCYQVWLSTL